MSPLIFLDAQLALEAGQSAMTVRRWEEAVDALEQAIALDPECFEASKLLLDIALTAGDPTLSRRILARVSDFVASHPSPITRKRQLPPPGPAGAAYQLRLTLKDSDPPIWRRVLVTSNNTLAKLHRTIQQVMCWENRHLHEFATESGDLYGTPNLKEDLEYNITIHSERSVKLYQLLNTAGQRLEYHYDFGDGWEIDVILEEILPVAPNQHYPICLDGQRAAPPEDIGGIPGYQDFLEAQAKPWHPDYAVYSQRFDHFFDAEAFDLARINLALARMK